MIAGGNKYPCLPYYFMGKVFTHFTGLDIGFISSYYFSKYLWNLAARSLISKICIFKLPVKMLFWDWYLKLVYIWLSWKCCSNLIFRLDILGSLELQFLSDILIFWFSENVLLSWHLSPSCCWKFLKCLHYESEKNQIWY